MNQRVEHSRRDFLTQAAAVATAAWMPYDSTTSPALAKSPNKRLRFALIGVGGNGTRTSPVGQKFADLVALCDVDKSHLDDGNQLLCGGKADLYADYREVLSR